MGYPDGDFPWTFYFNAVPLPKWSQCWPASALVLARADMATWNERITSGDLFILECKIDHVGVIESEDPLRFKVLGLELLHVLLANKDAITASISPEGNRGSASPQAIYSAVVEGLVQMIDRAAADQIALWTVGYEADRLALAEAMRRCKLPPDHPEHRTPPHVERDNHEATFRLDWTRKLMLQAASGQAFPKSVRGLLQRLPSMQ